MSRRVFYSEFFCFEPEPGSYIEAHFDGKGANDIIEIHIRINDRYVKNAYLPQGFVEEIREVLRRWEREFPCHEWRE